MTGQLAHGPHLVVHGAERVMFGEEPMPTVPLLPRNLPSITATFPNGNAPASLLRGWPGDEGMPLLEIPSYGMQAFHLYAAEHGWEVRSTGRGRTLQQQTDLFLARYTTTVLAGRPSKMWNGQRWYLKPGMATAATPGTSNHGWWAADDMSLQLDDDPADEAVTAAFVEWAIPILPMFGWGWELQSELWHVHWLAGDLIPGAALAVLHRYGIPTPYDLEDDMQFYAQPDRLMDTRPLSEQISPGSLVEVNCKVPSAAKTVVVNLTAVDAAGPGFLVAWGSGSQPATSNVNYAAGQTIANLAFLVPDSQGNIKVTTGTSAADVVVDLQGYFA